MPQLDDYDEFSEGATYFNYEGNVDDREDDEFDAETFDSEAYRDYADE